MATSRASRQVYADLLARHGRLVADAFFKALDELRAGAELQRVMAAIESRDIDGALEALHIDPEIYNDVLDRIRDAQAEAGKATATAMPNRKPDGTALIVRFDARNLVAERRLAEYSSRLITRLVENDRAVVRASLSASMAQGVNPRTAGLRIVGRINRASGRREGGVLGLSTVQGSYVDNPLWYDDPRQPPGARQQLASGDPKLLKAYLTRERRDRRFDRTITKAIREGKPVPAETIQKAITAYERRLIQLRGEIVGRVETMTAIQSAKREAFRQAIDSGKVNEADVRKAWRSAGDGRVRHTHMAMNGDSARFNEPFVSPSGARLQFPMDTSLGAGPDEIIGCRCDCEYRIDFLANLR